MLAHLIKTVAALERREAGFHLFGAPGQFEREAVTRLKIGKTALCEARRGAS